MGYATGMTTLPTRTLGRTGLTVSILGYGAEPLGRRGRSYEDADCTLNRVLDSGITLIDTAAAYGNSEAFIGQAVAHRKQEFTLVTKCGWVNGYQPAWSPAEIAATIDESLRRLRTDCVDVLLLHSCELQLLQHGDVIEAVQRAQQQGKAKYIGYSGDNEALAFAVASDAFDVIETTFNILDQANADAIAQAASRNLGVIIKRPIANAVPGRTEPPPSEYAAQYWPRWQAIGLTDDDVDHLPWTEAALRFTAFWPGVTCALVGSSNPDHMADNARTVMAGPLPTSVVTRLRDAFAQAGANWNALG